MSARRLVAVIAAVVMLATACGSSGETAAPVGFEPINIANRGDVTEGHTPRTFAGSGTGLFSGDNLNPNFPNGAGIQILLSFDVPAGTAMPPTATLTSDALTERGNAFEALGPLQVEPVTYQTFGPPLFDLAADGPATTCDRPSPSSISCDVTDAVSAALARGANTVQLRVQFATMSDNDGEQDLALFFFERFEYERARHLHARTCVTPADA